MLPTGICSVSTGTAFALNRNRCSQSLECALDDLRTRFGFALVLEHHAPKGDGGAREMAPFGSQRWLAWPELGLGLYAEKDNSGLRVERFRGDRMAASWPDKLVRGQAWPFEGVWRPGLKRAAS